MIGQIVEFLLSHDILFRIIIGALFLGVLVVLFFLAKKYETSHVSNTKKIKKMAAIAILSGLSVALYYFPKFNLPFLPSFLEFHFSNVPILIGGFLFGPVSGSLIVVIRFLAKLPATSTLGVGEIMDLIIGLSTVLISSIIYHHHKSKKNAIIGMAASAAVWTLVAVLINWLFIVSFYIELYFGGSAAAFVGLLAMVPGVSETNYMGPYLLFAVVPFNLILSSFVSVITFILYKRISQLYEHDFSHHDKPNQIENDVNEKQA